MKKIAFFALAALCSAAQALSLSWSSTDFTNQQSKRVDFSNGQSATLALTITFTEAAASLGTDATFASATTDTITGEGLKNKGNGAHMHAYSANNGIGANVGNGGSGTWTSNRPAVGTTKHSVIITLDNDGSNTILKMYADGDLMERTDTLQNAFEHKDVTEWFFNIAANGELWTIHDAAIYDSVLDETQRASLVANGTSVPEPTALALLALGVAGLALKRKVA